MNRSSLGPVIYGGVYRGTLEFSVCIDLPLAVSGANWRDSISPRHLGVLLVPVRTGFEKKAVARKRSQRLDHPPQKTARRTIGYT